MFDMVLNTSLHFIVLTAKNLVESFSKWEKKMNFYRRSFGKKRVQNFSAGRWIGTYTEFSEKLTVLIPWYTHVRVCIRKTNSSYPVIHTRTCACQGVRHVSFSENFEYVPIKWSVRYIGLDNFFLFCFIYVFILLLIKLFHNSRWGS